MDELTKEEIAQWIRDIMPYVQQPVIIASQKAFTKDTITVKPGTIIEYDATLLPKPEIVDYPQTLANLVTLYRAILPAKIPARRRRKEDE